MVAMTPEFITFFPKREKLEADFGEFCYLFSGHIINIDLEKIMVSGVSYNGGGETRVVCPGIYSPLHQEL